MKDIAFRARYEIWVDDVSEGLGREFRCSIYDLDEDLGLVSDGWGDTPHEAIYKAFKYSEIGKNE